MFRHILIDVWDYDHTSGDDFMGFAIVTIHELFQNHLSKQPIPLLPGQPGEPWGGELYVENIEYIAKGSLYLEVVLTVPPLA